VEATRSLTGTLEEDGVSRMGTSYFNNRMALMLRVRGEEFAFMLQGEELDDVVIGRTDPNTGERPKVDLTPYGASDKGVSRKHARINRRENNALHLTDLDSANSTYLNGQRLIPNQPRILRNGDELRLGRLVITVEFTRGTASLGTNPLPATANLPGQSPATSTATQEISKALDDHSTPVNTPTPAPPADNQPLKTPPGSTPSGSALSDTASLKAIPPEE
jgi:hypothetical protein